VRPLSVHVPPGERRNPVAVVRTAVGLLEVVLPVSRLRKSALTVRSPMADGGLPAVSAAPEVWAEVERAAVAAVLDDPAAAQHVLGKRFRRADALAADAGSAPA
jgi:hypothetical protein